MDQGAIHLQIGKSYLYREGLEEKSFNIVEKIKNHMDPNGLINPGSLGL
jgi:FAD/FMN-containing dehydrogenase